jgi:hypothetical protein
MKTFDKLIMLNVAVTDMVKAKEEKEIVSRYEFTLFQSINK